MKYSRLIMSIIALFAVSDSWASKCLYVSSYHQGYEWNDGIEKGLTETLKDACELKKFYFDTKRNTKKEWAEWKAREAVKLIKEYKPDVVIAADDNASRYLIVPYYMNGKIPFVFCGLNWSMKEYGFPYKNVTGMLEVAPVKALIKQLKLFKPRMRRGVFLSSDVITEHKDYKHYKKYFEKYGISLDARYVKTMRAWTKEYRKAQSYDFVFLGNNAGINDWYKPEASRVVRQYTKKPSVTSYKWMLPYVVMGFTKLPEEQGQWAAKVALAILGGMEPSQIPVVNNRRWDMWINPSIIEKINLKIPFSLYNRAKHYR